VGAGATSRRDPAHIDRLGAAFAARYLMRRGRARVGCSGWQYRHWRGSFYPSEIAFARWFDHYASVFDTVEINNSFYRLPEATTFARWAERAPRDFLFAVKASRYLTHLKKLKEPESPLERFFERADHLGRHLGPVLYQLPPGWKLDVPRLEHFLQVLPRQVRHAIEFREASWYSDDVLELLRAQDVALCLHDMRGSATERMRVASFVYVRFHGPSGQYAGGYSRERLCGWASWLGAQLAEGVDVYAYFNNDAGGHAPRDALTLRGLLETSSC
jgi:uncharacterized protein YecE (DUF72 family)